MKKHYLAVLFLFYIGNAAALPDCPSSPSEIYHNCYGELIFDSGNKYIGEWKDDQRNGQGTFIWPDGENYVGGWKDGNEHGQGTYSYANGDQYVGEYKDGQKHGQGTYSYSTSGNKYVGEWKDGKKHGQGTFNFADGTAKRGYFSNDEYVPDICEDMGLKKGSAEFGQCVLKLMDD